MTTSATATFDPAADEVITDALRLLGVLNADQTAKPGHLALGRRMLSYIMKAIANEGVSVRVIERVTVTSPAQTITPASDTEDVTKMFWTGVDGTDHPMERRSRDDYDDLSVKATSSPPTQFTFDQTNGNLTILLYPVPDANVASVTYVRQRRLRDIDAGDVTFDLPSKWALAILSKLQALLAPHFGKRGQVADLEAAYQYEKELALGADSERGPVRFVVDEDAGYDYP